MAACLVPAPRFIGGLRRLLGVSLALAGCAAQPSAMTPSPASQGEFHLPDGPDTVRRFRVLVVSDSGERTLARMSMAEFHRPAGSDAGLLQVQESPDFHFTDTLLIERDQLRPRWERLRTGGRVIRIEYAGARVSRWERHGDSAAVTSEVRFHEPVFAFNQLELLVRSVPLRVGYQRVLPLYSEATAELEHDTLTVVAGRDGSVWTVRFADPAIISTYRLKSGSREVLEQETVVRATGARYRRVSESG